MMDTWNFFLYTAYYIHRVTFFTIKIKKNPRKITFIIKLKIVSNREALIMYIL